LKKLSFVGAFKSNLS